VPKRRINNFMNAKAKILAIAAITITTAAVSVFAACWVNSTTSCNPVVFMVPPPGHHGNCIEGSSCWGSHPGMDGCGIHSTVPYLKEAGPADVGYDWMKTDNYACIGSCSGIDDDGCPFTINRSVPWETYVPSTVLCHNPSPPSSSY